MHSYLARKHKNEKKQKIGEMAKSLFKGQILVHNRLKPSGKELGESKAISWAIWQAILLGIKGP